MGYIQEVERSFGGQLGKKTGARYRTYTKLVGYYEENKDTLFVTDALKKAIDDIYKYPLRDTAKDTLNRKLKSGINPSELAELVIALREENRLCLVDEAEVKRRDPQIICSLGMRVQ